MIISEHSQKRGLFNKKKITLKSDKSIVEETTAQSKKKYEIDLNDIGYKKYYEADNTAVGKIATAILFIIPMFLIGAYILGKTDLGSTVCVTILFWLFVIFSLLKSNKDDIFLVGGSQSFLYIEINRMKRLY